MGYEAKHSYFKHLAHNYAEEHYQNPYEMSSAIRVLMSELLENQA